jgi:hypothetical protein
MSAKVATATSVVLTDKFKKELDKFFSWAITSEYIIKDINDEQHEWSIKLLTKFEEPGRNKLEAYIKSLFAKYTISINDMDIEDAKLLAKEFKEKGETSKKASKKADDSETEKPKKKTTKKSDEVEEKPKKKTTKKAKIDDESETEEKPKKKTKKSEEVKEVEPEESNIKLDMSLDTTECYNVDTLEFWTSELTQVFGKPKKTGGKDSEHTWEWKVEVNGQPFTIYDWNENGESFDDTTWYLGATSDNKKNIKSLISYIESWFDAPEEVEVKVESKKETKTKSKAKKEIVKEIEEIKEEIKEEKIDMDELFGPSDDEDGELELDLDDIEDDE